MPAPTTPPIAPQNAAVFADAFDARSATWSYALPASDAWRFGAGVQYTLSPKSELGIAAEYLRSSTLRDPSPVIGGKYEDPYMVFMSAHYSYRF